MPRDRNKEQGISFAIVTMNRTPPFGNRHGNGAGSRIAFEVRMEAEPAQKAFAAQRLTNSQPMRPRAPAQNRFYMLGRQYSRAPDLQAIAIVL